MIFSSIIIEPWESEYMVFIAPGLLMWVCGLIWWIRSKSNWFTIALQGIAAIEIALGGITAHLVGNINLYSGFKNSGVADVFVDIADEAYTSVVAIIGLAIHLALITATFIMAIVTARHRQRNAQQAMTHQPA